jgi:hypothetical protein
LTTWRGGGLTSSWLRRRRGRRRCRGFIDVAASWRRRLGASSWSSCGRRLGGTLVVVVVSSLSSCRRRP